VVFLKKLELFGFKTFAKRTSITFDQGLNAIIGPNGSGKTNIVDAIQFVLGELSVRSLRAQNFSSLLSYGNSEIPKAKHAVVSLQFENSDRRLPVDTDIVTLSRYIGTDGVSTYRVNGKRYSRGNLVDILGVAALTGGMNIIFQGTTMRIADYSPEDRRKNIESIIGIAEYDRKKEEAQVELREAETNLKVAAGTYAEVKKRLVELEKERNDFLRYSYTKNELNRLRAVRLSHNLTTLRQRLQQLNTDIVTKTAELEEVRKRHEKLEEERLDKEKEWQEYAEKVLDKGGDQLFTLQSEIGDLNSEITGLKTTVSSSKISLQSYENMLKGKIENLKSVRDNIATSQKELKRLMHAREEVEATLDARKKQRDELVGKITEIKDTVDTSSAKLAELEDQIEQFEREQGQLEVKIKAEKESCDILTDQIQTLESRKKNFEDLYSNFAERLKSINQMRQRERRRFEDILQSIERAKRQRDVGDLEIKNAEKVVKHGRISITEFRSRKELAETLLSEEKALEHLENLAKLGALTGVHGRLNERIRISGEYKKAVEAAAEGWLHALIVDSMDVVWKCAESLKRAKIGRVKLLPLTNLRSVKLAEKPKLAGITGSVASVIECAVKYRPAVNFVFGDTFVATSEEAALKASDQGYRVVTADGQVFEPGLRLEVGFYRTPIDLSEVIPSDVSIKRIDETVTSLEQLLDRRDTDIRRLGDELVRLEGDKTAQADMLKSLDQQTEELGLNIDRIHKDIVELNRRLRSFKHRYESLQNSITSSKTRMEAVEKQLHALRLEAANVRKKLKPETVTRMEGERATLESEISNLERRYNETLSKIETLDSNLKNILTPSLTTARGEIAGIRSNIHTYRRSFETASKRLEETTLRLKELETSKENLTSMLLTKKEESKKFNEIIEEIRNQLKKVDKEFEPRNELVNSLKQESVRCQMEIEQAERELKLLGFEASVVIKAEDLAILESSIEQLQTEFKNLADKVNMMAVEFYEPQKTNYKELSVRINQLEEEKRAILKFMDAVERERQDAFFSALGKVNQKFSESFNLITGGKGWLQLQNPEDPFKGGLDIIVEFPGKAQTLVTGASGGEKSVVAVCYIFALQTLAKTSPFYIFDEIDAHLDPINVQRLAELLAQEAQKAQIIAITFKEPVAAKANRVFGLYGKSGVSYVYSMPKVT